MVPRNSSSSSISSTNSNSTVVLLVVVLLIVLVVLLVVVPGSMVIRETNRATMSGTFCTCFQMVSRRQSACTNCVNLAMSASSSKNAAPLAGSTEHSSRTRYTAPSLNSQGSLARVTCREESRRAHTLVSLVSEVGRQGPST